jgi:hypothetical protein
VEAAAADSRSLLLLPTTASNKLPLIKSVRKP